MVAGLQVVAAPLRKEVIRRLRDSILTLQYEPGQRLLERDLCDRFGVSRTVIREALRHLEAEGLVELVPNHGPVVAQVKADDARAVFDSREAVESLAARYFAERATPRQRKRLETALNRVEAAYKGGRLLEEFRAKDEFYNVLLEGCGNAVITSVLRTIHARAQMYRAYAHKAPGRTTELVAELRDMVAAIATGDVEAAQRTAAAHVHKGGETVLRALAQLEASAEAEAEAQSAP
jgi:DNA-binding GntR family transcriptional regulator